MAAIALVEDEDLQASILQATLSIEGHDVTRFADARSFLASTTPFDLVVLDWELPDCAGIRLLEQGGGGRRSRPPILMLTKRACEDDVRAALDAGADDYVIKPARPRELAARVRNLLRRYAGGVESAETAVDTDAADLAPYSLDRSHSTVLLNDRGVGLTARESAIAVALFRNFGDVVSRTELERRVLGMSPLVSSRTLDSHISRLRRKLELDGRHGWVLSSVYRHGYRISRGSDEQPD